MYIQFAQCLWGHQELIWLKIAFNQLPLHFRIMALVFWNPIRHSLALWGWLRYNTIIGWINWNDYTSLLSSYDTFCIIINKVILFFLVAEGEECWGKCWQGSQICSSLSPNSGHTPGSPRAHITQTRAASGDNDVCWRKQKMMLDWRVLSID